jgi:CHAT domain-containing protein
VDAEAVVHLAQAALSRAARTPSAAERWVAIGASLNQRLGDIPALQAQLSYAQARVYVQMGQLALAETALHAAQAAYEAIDDRVALARSHLGLTQILSMQGRYNDAESAGLQAIFQLQAAANHEPDLTLQLAGAHRNLATLLVYQEKHTGALEEYERAQQILQRRISASGTQSQASDDLWRELAHVNMNQASALMSLDRTYEAEAALQTAINIFDRIGDVLDRGRARTNLGSLYLRTGRYAVALTHFESAARDLIGDMATAETIPPEHLLHADILLLDQANVYLALNLLAEATNTIQHCVSFFRLAGLPYELGQALVASGLVRMRMNDEQGAEVAFLEAERLFLGLHNLFWQNRTAIALATLEYQRGAWLRAANRLDALLAQRQADVDPTGVVEWDIGTLVDAYLLRLRIHLQRDEHDAARQMAIAAASALGLPPTDLTALPLQQAAFPHFMLRLHHALGELERAQGNREQAQRHFRAAITLLESQRTSLPVEEIRTSFLDDKTTLYSDLVLSLLEDPDVSTIAEAFAMVERARSRALLERLLVSMAGEGMNEASDVAARRADLQQQLHLLYNRLLGETGSRYAALNIGEAIRQREAVLQQLNWRGNIHLPEAQPVDLAALQQALPDDQQAIVYFIAGAEVMAFVISREQVHVFRHLCSVVDLVQAKAEWRFQLGRAEMDNDYVNRHAERFERGWRNALAQIYNLLLAPLMERLTAPRLLLIPYGSLHLLPLHALWDGHHFLLEHFECAYAPSASVAVRLLGRQTPREPYRSWAGLAVTDPAIPAARAEVEAAARHFSQAWLYLDEAANQAALAAASQQGDILHLATHGLFRPDNPFFSVLKLADGWVDVRSIYRLPLAARLVVLSACESGAGEVRSGDEVIGLARGFLALGAESLLVSLWNVHDASSANLMKRFYGHLVNNGHSVRPAAALRAAQLAMIGDNPHPYYWAPFLMIGG